MFSLFKAEILPLGPDIVIFYAAHNDHSVKLKLNREGLF